MLNLHGHYDYALATIGNIPKDVLSGKVSAWDYIDKHGKDWLDLLDGKDNLVSDIGLQYLNGQLSGGAFDNAVQLLFISQSVESLLIDYRKQTGVMGFTLDDVGTKSNVIQTGTSWQGEYNFPVPGAMRTITIVGIKTGGSTVDGNILSFISLSTPVTQNTNQLFFVRYILQGTYSGVTGIGGVSNPWVINRINEVLFTNTFSTPKFKLTSFKKPVTTANVGREPSAFFSDYGFNSPFPLTKVPTKFRLGFAYNLGTADLPNTHGCAVQVLASAYSADVSQPVYAINEQDTTPQIGTLFQHADGDDSVFSNPGTPPSGKGAILITGTSTASQVFKRISIEITVTGEANDTPDGNTGKFKYGVNGFSVINTRFTQPLKFGTSLVTTETDYWTYAQNNTSNPKFAILVGSSPNDFLYYGGTSPSGDNWVMKWRFNTIECSTAITQITPTINHGVAIGTNIWMATSNGLLKYDTTTDSLTATYTTSNGLQDNNCTDLAYDTVSGRLWVGHDQGLSQVNPIGPVITAYSNGSGDAFDGLTNDQMKIYKGQLSAHNGFVCRGGERYNVSFSDDIVSPWIFEVATLFWVRIPMVNFVSGGSYSAITLVGDGTGRILVVENSNSQLTHASVWTVTPTAPNAGSFSQDQTISIVFGTSFPGTPGKIVRINKNHFTIPMHDNNGQFIQSDYFIDSNILYTINRGNLAYTLGSPGNNNNNNFPVEVDGITYLFTHGYLVPSVKQQLYGWTGSAWDKDTLTDRYIPDTSFTLVNGINYNFDNTAPFPAAQQFIVGENYTLVTGPGVIKSNLQTMTYKAYAYLADLKLFPATNITVSGGGTYTAPQAALSDFLSIEDDESYIVIKDVPFTTVYTQVPSSPGAFEYSINPTTGVFTFNISEAGNTLNLKFYYLERH